MARQHLFSEEPPGAVVVDTSYIIEALFEGGMFHEECAAFANELLVRNVILIYSPLLFLETPQAWRRLWKRGLLPPPIPGSLWVDDPSIRKQMFENADRVLNNFLELFEVYEVRLTKRLLIRTRDTTAQYDLGSHDSLVVATALNIGVSDIVAIDEHFLSVENVDVWNKDIPSRRQQMNKQQ